MVCVSWHNPSLAFNFLCEMYRGCTWLNYNKKRVWCVYHLFINVCRCDNFCSCICLLLLFQDSPTWLWRRWQWRRPSGAAAWSRSEPRLFPIHLGRSQAGDKADFPQRIVQTCQVECDYFGAWVSEYCGKLQKIQDEVQPKRLFGCLFWQRTSL